MYVQECWNWDKYTVGLISKLEVNKRKGDYKGEDGQIKVRGLKRDTDGTKNATIRRSNATDNNKTMSENNEKDTNEGTNDRTVRRKTY